MEIKFKNSLEELKKEMYQGVLARLPGYLKKMKEVLALLEQHNNNTLE